MLLENVGSNDFLPGRELFIECCFIISNVICGKGMSQFAKSYIMSAAVLYKQITHTLYKQTVVT